jgi:hypothetical protein
MKGITMLGKLAWIGTSLLIFTSLSSASDDGFLRKTTLDLLDAYCPDGRFIVRSALSLVGTVSDKDFTGMIDGSDERACLNAINTIVHEDNHTLHTFWGREVLKKKFGSFSDVFYSYDYFYLSDGAFTLMKKTPTFPSREMIPTIPENLRTFRFPDYIDTSEELQSTQHEGIYGLLDEYNSYYHGTRASFDLLGYYEKKGKSATWHDYFTGVNSTYYACLEFRFFILKYLMYAKAHHPDLYQGILDNKAWCYTFIEVDRNASALLREYFAEKPAVFERLRGYGWTVSEQNGYLYINQGNGNAGHMNFMNVVELLDGEMKKSEYLDMTETVREHARGWNPESVYAVVEAEMKDSRYTDTQGGKVDPNAPRLENRASLEDIADETDPEGDAAHPFIDLVKASVEKDADGLIVRMRLADLSGPLTFNQPRVPDNAMEYRWAAMFDMDGDGEDDYSVELVGFKNPGAKTVRGGIVENTQKSLWKLTGDGAEMVEARVRGEQKGNELILEVLPCGFVSSIGGKTRVHFKTFYSDGKTEDEDRMPD